MYVVLDSRFPGKNQVNKMYSKTLIHASLYIYIFEICEFVRKNQNSFERLQAKIFPQNTY